LSSPFTSTTTRQGDTSNTSDWSDNDRVLLFVVSQKLSLNFRGKETPQHNRICTFLYRIKTQNLSTECQTGLPNNGSS
jgi:hypothetical protein